ncbi:GH25 family lysozyme [Carnobacterium divergens]
MKKLNKNIFAVLMVMVMLVPTVTAEAALNKYSQGLPNKDFIDVASHQGSISTNDYQIIKNEGVKGVSVKLTEGTSYVNPYAQAQINNAKAVGLQVSAYHFSRYISVQDAKNEANFFVNTAKRFGLSTDTLMVNDAEASEFMRDKLTNNVFNKAFDDQMRSYGFKNTEIYTMGSWVNTRFNINDGEGWIANYPGYPTSTMNLYSNRSAWQFASDYQFIGINNTGTKNFDVSVDYKGNFTRGVKDQNKPVPTDPVAPLPTNEYVVVSGDTLGGIGSKVNKNWQDIARTNNILTPYTIFPGQVLKLAGTNSNGGGTNQFYYKVVSGDSLSAIGNKLGVSWQAIAQINGKVSPFVIYPGENLKVPNSSSNRSYTVKAGDSLSGIAQTIGVSINELASKNNITNVNLIFPNQVLNY